jgi:hypothetical protein
MANRAGPAREKPITTVASEAAFSDWPPPRGFHHGPGSNTDPTQEAEDAFAVLPLASMSHSADRSKGQR